MGVMCWLGMKYTQFSLQAGFFTQLGVFTGLILGATVFYLGVAWLLRCHEIEEVYGIAVRRTTGGAEGRFGVR